jgi:hypothetical protein
VVAWSLSSALAGFERDFGGEDRNNNIFIIKLLFIQRPDA